MLHVSATKRSHLQRATNFEDKQHVMQLVSSKCVCVCVCVCVYIYVRFHNSVISTQSYSNHISYNTNDVLKYVKFCIQTRCDSRIFLRFIMELKPRVKRGVHSGTKVLYVASSNGTENVRLCPTIWRYKYHDLTAQFTCASCVPGKGYCKRQNAHTYGLLSNKTYFLSSSVFWVITQRRLVKDRRFGTNEPWRRDRFSRNVGA
jgi:hypothetical protein